jgi:hypothetical protein
MVFWAGEKGSCRTKVPKEVKDVTINDVRDAVASFVGTLVASLTTPSKGVHLAAIQKAHIQTSTLVTASRSSTTGGGDWPAASWRQELENKEKEKQDTAGAGGQPGGGDWPAASWRQELENKEKEKQDTAGGQPGGGDWPAASWRQELENKEKLATDEGPSSQIRSAPHKRKSHWLYDGLQQCPCCE